MEHSHDSINNVKRSFINLEPLVEGDEHLCTKILAGQGHHILKWPGDSL